MWIKVNMKNARIKRALLLGPPMTRFDLAIRRLTTPLMGTIAALTIMASTPAHAEIDIASLGGQSTMAEQGAICASFAALMENQVLINQDLGDLWSERRKFSGAVIRRAVELSGQDSPDSEQIDRLINDCLLYTSPSPRDLSTSRMPSSA